MKLAMGRFGFFSPTRARLMALTASSWPMIRVWRVSSILRRRSDSSADTLSTGMPVHEATMCWMSTTVTTGPVPCLSLCPTHLFVFVHEPIFVSSDPSLYHVTPQPVNEFKYCKLSSNCREDIFHTLNSLVAVNMYIRYVCFIKV